MIILNNFTNLNSQKIKLLMIYKLGFTIFDEMFLNAAMALLVTIGK